MANPTSASRHPLIFSASSRIHSSTATSAPLLPQPIFFYFNGLSVEAEQADIIQLVMMVAAGEIDEAGAAAFFRDHVVKVEA